MPDGDTGTNLTLTVRAVDEALAGDGPDDRAGLAKEVSRAALMGARGNSGVILSQIVRGATDALAESDDLARAFRSASDAAYRAVKKPVEGTMLTAIREMADAAEHGRDLPAIVARGRRDASRRRASCCRCSARRASSTRARPGCSRSSAGSRPRSPARRCPSRRQREELGIEAIHQELSRYRYCTVFVVEGDGSTPTRSSRSSSGSATRCSSSATDNALKVHVHTDDPGRALSLGVARGAIDGVEIANMHAQTQQREERLLHAVAGRRPDARASSRSRRATATARSSRAAARSSSTAARR